MKLCIDNEKLVNLNSEITFKTSSSSSSTSTRSINHDGVERVTEKTDIGEAIQELNKDSVDLSTRMTAIDLRSNLHPVEISGILCVDTLVSMQFLPLDCLPFTRQKKRLAVSQRGKGRNDIVNIVAGKRETEERKGGVMGMFGGFGKNE